MPLQELRQKRRFSSVHRSALIALSSRIRQTLVWRWLYATALGGGVLLSYQGRRGVTPINYFGPIPIMSSRVYEDRMQAETDTLETEASTWLARSGSVERGHQGLLYHMV